MPRPLDNQGNPIYTFNQGDKVNTQQCAQFKNAFLAKWGFGTYGDAWTPQNTNLVYSGYEGIERPAEYSRPAVEKYNDEASDNFRRNFNSTAALDTTKMYDANLYYRGSNYLPTAFKNGQGVSGTHTGAVRWRNTTSKNPGSWEVVHNIDGNIHVDPFTQIQGKGRKYGITAIYEPEKKGFVDRAIENVKKRVSKNYFELEKLRNGGVLNFLNPIMNKYNK